MRDEALTTGPEDDLVAQLVDAGDQLPASVEEALLGRGRAIVPALLEILSDPDACDVDSHGAGYAPIHAVALLGKLGATDAIAPMLGVLSWCDAMDVLYSGVIAALEAVGPPVLEPALAAHREARSLAERTAIAEVLSRIGVRDDRSLEILLRTLDEDVDLGSSLLAEYGDPAALSALGAALDRLVLDVDTGPFANQAAIELEAAIDELGGVLSEDQRRKFDEARRMRLKVGGLRPGAALEDDDPDEERAYAERQDLLRRFSASPHASGADPSWVELALDYAAGFDGRFFAELDAGTLRQVLFQHFPRKVSCEPSAASEIVRSLRAFWTFAGDELHHPTRRPAWHCSGMTRSPASPGRSTIPRTSDSPSRSSCRASVTAASQP